MPTYEPGTQIELREVLHGSLWLSMPVTVVGDDGTFLAVRLDDGAPMTFPIHPYGRHPWAGANAWARTTVLQLYRSDDWYAVWRMFEGSTLLGTYINFEAPVVRGQGHIDTVDYGVDIVIEPDGTWRWKDVEDVDGQVRNGRISPGTAERVMDEARRFAADLQRGAGQWWADWSAWRPR